MEAKKFKESGGDMISQVLDLLSDSDKVSAHDNYFRNLQCVISPLFRNRPHEVVAFHPSFPFNTAIDYVSRSIPTIICTHTYICSQLYPCPNPTVLLNENSPTVNFCYKINK